MENKAALSDAQIGDALAALDGWQRDGAFIHKDFVFANFAEINQFLPHLAQSIVAQNHHPDFGLDTGSKTVSVRMTTHSHSGITQADINLAQALDAWR
ncbi:MAG: 4a-hydroxytetrahydrobiopterin dehydratase [Rhodothermales bacterium]|jgi:4a-hydroxytetrahydrobiopterin dehydratase